MFSAAHASQHQVLANINQLEQAHEARIDGLKAAAEKDTAKILAPLKEGLKKFAAAGWYEKGDHFLAIERALTVLREPTNPLTPIVGDFVVQHERSVDAFEQGIKGYQKQLKMLLDDLLATAATTVAKSSNITIKDAYQRLDGLSALAGAEKAHPSLAPLVAVYQATCSHTRRERLDAVNQFGTLALSFDKDGTIEAAKKITTKPKK